MKLSKVRFIVRLSMLSVLFLLLVQGIFLAFVPTEQVKIFTFFFALVGGAVFLGNYLALLQLKKATTPPSTLPFEDFVEMELSDYSIYYNSIDAAEIGRSVCKDCGHKLKYRGFKKDSSYRAFAVCDFCETYYEV